MKTIIIAMAVFLATATPAAAHTEAEQQEWEDQWVEEVMAEGLTPRLLTKRLDFLQRHVPQETARRTAPSVPYNTGMGSGVEKWRGLVASHFSDVDRALCIMSHESGGNPNAKNPRSSARGLFQILASLWAPHYGVSYSDLYDPELNVRLAADIQAQYGWWAWSPYKRGLCR